MDCESFSRLFNAPPPTAAELALWSSSIGLTVPTVAVPTASPKWALATRLALAATTANKWASPPSVASNAGAKLTFSPIVKMHDGVLPPEHRAFDTLVNSLFDGTLCHTQYALTPSEVTQLAKKIYSEPTIGACNPKRCAILYNLAVDLHQRLQHAAVLDASRSMEDMPPPPSITRARAGCGGVSPRIPSSYVPVTHFLVAVLKLVCALNHV